MSVCEPPPNIEPVRMLRCAKPMEVPLESLGLQATFHAVSVRRSLAGLLSKKGDSVSVPTNAVPDQAPAAVLIGWLVRTKTRGIPGASGPSSRWPRMPGPHDCELLEMPMSAAPSVAHAADWPSVAPVTDDAPYRVGRSIE